MPEFSSFFVNHHFAHVGWLLCACTTPKWSHKFRQKKFHKKQQNVFFNKNWRNIKFKAKQTMWEQPFLFHILCLSVFPSSLPSFIVQLLSSSSHLLSFLSFPFRASKYSVWVSFLFFLSCQSMKSLNIFLSLILSFLLSFLFSFYLSVRRCFL